MGMHHDGMHFFAINSSTHGLLVINHEYTDDGLLHSDGMNNWNAEKVKKSQAANGVSIIEILFKNNEWHMVRPSRYARRITATTPMHISGPAAGHPLMKTLADPEGVRVLGTLNNCASGITPWGTYLTCEENFMYYFKEQTSPDAHHKRWTIKKDSGYFRWNEFDERFDSNKHPNEPNRFGWIVEIDPFNPQAIPVKRTALGRATHEGATITVTADGRAVVYSGEDAHFEYIYKFVSRDKIAEGGAAPNANLLDHGTLYVAKFNDDFSGEWLPLIFGEGPLTAANGFSNQGEVVIKTRQASDMLAATKMDRPEWIVVDTKNNEVYCSLTNNSRRGKNTNPGKDNANPRNNNTMGQIIRWKEADDFDSTRFNWSHFVLAGSPANQREEAKGNIRGDIFACPDGLFIDQRGVLWIETDMSTEEIGKGDYQYMGNNALLAADTKQGEIRRFLTAPNGAEITGATTTPDGCNLFINIQHPGEEGKKRSDPAKPDKISSWPYGGRPRSATVIIRKNDGGIIGT
jgi:secreted PhoX family phosphatase